MGAIINGSLEINSLPKEKFIKHKNGKVYYNFTIFVNDDTRYGNNVSIADAQTKEEREAKTPKNYIGNGKVTWTDGKIVLAEKEEKTTQPVGKKVVVEVDDDLPF